MRPLPKLNLPLAFLSPTPGGGELRSPPPANISRSTHRTRTHTGQTDPHGTRDTHTEPHGTSTRDAHKGFSSLHIKLSCVCGTVSCLISPVGYGVCMLATSVNSGAVLCGPLAHGMSMRPYRLTQSSREASLETALALARAAAMVSHRSRVILEMTDMLC